MREAETGGLDLKTLATLRGCEVTAADGIGLGELQEIVYDYESESPVWVGVAPSHGFHFHTLLVPTQGAVEDAGTLRVAFSSEEILEEPPADLGEGFDSVTAQRHLYDYFSVPMDEMAEVRVLRTGEDLPGLEVNR